MKVVITGGAGFIGSHLCERLLNDGHEVVCLDNLVSGAESNITHLSDNPRFQFIQHDVTQPLEIEGKVDAILHFASPASPNPDSPVSYMSHPVETMLVNSTGSKNMLDLAKKHDAQIILASTSEIYGEPEVHPQPEKYRGNVSTTGPRACYDESKRFMEAISSTYYREYGTKVKIIRIFNTYGPRMRLDDGRLIPNLVSSYIQDKPFPIFGEGSQTRSFCYVSDLVDGIMAVFSSDKMVGEVVNLGNPDEFSVTQLVNLFEEITGEKLEVVSAPAQIDDPSRRRPDISKAQSLLSWSPTIKLEDGLKKTLTFFRDQG